MLPYPQNNLLDFVTSDEKACFRPGTNRIITEETSFEVVTEATGSNSLILRVERYKEEKLYATFKYATPSRTFASIEFYNSGCFHGSTFMIKPIQSCMPEGRETYNSYIERRMYASVAVGLVISAGFVPSPWLIAQAPILTDPNGGDSTIYLQWNSYLIKPSPDVVLRVLFP